MSELKPLNIRSVRERLRPVAISLHTNYGPGPAVDARATDGLAIHQEIDEPTPKWVITHIRSGLAIPWEGLQTEDEAIDALTMLLAQPIDWTKSQSQINRDKEAIAKLKILCNYKEKVTR